MVARSVALPSAAHVIPVATTTIDIYTPDADEPYEPDTYSVLYSTVPAHIGSPSGADVVANAGQATITHVLNCAVTVIGQNDRVVDTRTDVVYEVVWSDVRYGLGLDHTRAGLRRIEGLGQ
jgi:hypothetical protein